MNIHPSIHIQDPKIKDFIESSRFVVKLVKPRLNVTYLYFYFFFFFFYTSINLIGTTTIIFYTTYIRKSIFFCYVHIFMYTNDVFKQGLEKTTSGIFNNGEITCSSNTMGE
jgi:hypothetical protein